MNMVGMSILEGYGTDITFHTLLKGLEKFVFKAGPHGYCLSPPSHHLHAASFTSPNLIHVSVSSKHRSVYVEPKPLHLEKFTCFLALTPLLTG